MENYKERYKETLLLLEEANNTIKMLRERIEERCTSNINDEDEDEEDDDYYDSEIDSEEDEEDEEDELKKDVLIEDNDYTEEEIIKIREKMQSFTKYAEVPLEPVYTIKEVFECEKRIGFELPIHLKNYITKVSREYRCDNYGLNQVIDLDALTVSTYTVFLNGPFYAENNVIYIQGKRKNKIYTWNESNHYREYARKGWNNFKQFIMHMVNFKN